MTFYAFPIEKQGKKGKNITVFLKNQLDDFPKSPNKFLKWRK